MVIPGKIVAGVNSQEVDETKKFIVDSFSYSELILSRPKEFCFGVTTLDRRLYIYLNNSWVSVGSVSATSTSGNVSEIYYSSDTITRQGINFYNVSQVYGTNEYFTNNNLYNYNIGLDFDFKLSDINDEHRFVLSSTTSSASVMFVFNQYDGINDMVYYDLSGNSNILYSSANNSTNIKLLISGSNILATFKNNITSATEQQNISMSLSADSILFYPSSLGNPINNCITINGFFENLTSQDSAYFMSGDYSSILSKKRTW